MVVLQKTLAECTGTLEKVINALLLQINAFGSMCLMQKTVKTRNYIRLEPTVNYKTVHDYHAQKKLVKGFLKVDK